MVIIEIEKEIQIIDISFPAIHLLPEATVVKKFSAERQNILAVNF